MPVDRMKILEILPYLPLEGLVEKYPHWNFRCPICGDSKKSKNKKRGWIRKKEHKDEYYFRCFNCGLVLSIPEFVKQLDDDLYRQFFKVDVNYIKKKLEKKTPQEIKEEKTNQSARKQLIKEIESVLEEVDEFFEPVIKFKEPLQYLKKRKIPEKHFRKIYFSNTKTLPFSQMIILPFFYDEKRYYGFQGRSYKEKKFYTSSPLQGFKVYNIFNVNHDEEVYVFEAIFDSLFVDNSIAMLGSDLTKNVEYFIPKKNLIFIFDNDETGYKKSIKYFYNGYKILIYPEKFKYKDINDAVIAGYLTEENVQDFIQENIFDPQKDRISGLVRLKIKGV
jgi:transcription elongation factor Elf1